MIHFTEVKGDTDKTRKFIMLLGLGLILSSSPAFAVTIDNLNGQTCAGGEIGAWHFVNNKTGGATTGTLTANWSSGDSCVVGLSSVLKSTIHFDCNARGTRQSASMNLPGKVVLSHYTCGSMECDPKTEICEHLSSSNVAILREPLRRLAQLPASNDPERRPRRCGESRNDDEEN